MALKSNLQQVLPLMTVTSIPVVTWSRDPERRDHWQACPTATQSPRVTISVLPQAKSLWGKLDSLTYGLTMAK